MASSVTAMESVYRKTASTRYRQVHGDGPYGCLNCGGDTITLLPTMDEAREQAKNPCDESCRAQHKVGRVIVPEYQPPLRIWEQDRERK